MPGYFRAPIGAGMLVFAFACSGAASDADERDAAGDASETQLATLPEGRYRCYIMRAGEGGTLGAAQSPGSAADPTGAGMSGVLGKYQGHLNILPGGKYDWFGNEEKQGEYDYDSDSGEIEWQGGTFGDGSVTAELGENSEGTPVIRMHYALEDGGSLDHSCRLSTP